MDDLELAQVYAETDAQANLDYFSKYLTSLGVEGDGLLAQLSSDYDATEL